MEKLVDKLKKFYKGKNILVTGHTGFKGSWLSIFLNILGANVIGYSLNPPTDPSLFELAKIDKILKSYYGDIKDIKRLKEVMDEHKPHIVFHMAAQPLVIDSYRDPLNTYETNVLGTLNVLEVIRITDYVKSFVNVTTDKVYKNNEWIWGYREDEELDGFDPYSNSKSCAELITKTYKRALLNNRVAVSTARAGNVIGGGDFSENRIIPDCMRSLLKSEDIIVRNPNSVRPYQHVLDPLMAYILIAYNQSLDLSFSDEYNVGPEEEDCVSTGKLVEIFTEHSYKKIKFIQMIKLGPHEANFLKLDNSKIKDRIKWKPKWTIDISIKKTIEWIYAFEYNPNNIVNIINQQINEYLEKE
jgi:CDP-glucose 4,6-dehydratase